MAGRDYVTKKTTRKTSSDHDKTSSKLMLTLTVAVLAIFIGILAILMMHNRQKSVPEMPVTDNAVKTLPVQNVLPPKPEDRWQYIKELENRATGNVVTKRPVEISGNLVSTKPAITANRPLSDEQRLVLENLQRDQRIAASSQPTGAKSESVKPLLEKPIKVESVQNNKPNSSVFSDVKTTSKREVYKPDAKKDETSNEGVKSAETKAKPQTKSTTSTSTTDKTVVKEEGNKGSWIIQCGSFKAASGAEAVKVKLALSGIESKIVVSSSGWNRVIVGRYSSRDKANTMLSQLKSSGVSSCITLSGG